MGCSPSKGQLFAGIDNHQDKALQFGPYESNSHHFSGGTEIKNQTETEIASSGQSLLQDENTAGQLQGKRSTVTDIVRGSVDIEETNVPSHGEVLTNEHTDIKDDRRMKNNECKIRRPRKGLRKTVYMQPTLDAPQAMLEAHEAAYAYLKHNIPKYESLLGLLEKATQTQLSIQPMVTLLALQYEEINQALDEIATEGEQMLEMYGNQMVLIAAQNDILFNPDIPEVERNSNESSPDLLQHMLHHSIKKMRLVGDSVKQLGDTSLEETGVYFGSLSQLLAEKLGVKTATESRLKEILACVESYALRNLNTEDTALHSEDSGIVVENEGHNGSVGRCSHQESSASRASIQSSYGCPEGSLPDQPYVNENEEDDDKDTDAENINGDEEPKHEQGSKTDRKMSNWSQTDPSQDPLQAKFQNKSLTKSTFEWSDQKEKNIRQRKAADDSFISYQRKHRHSHLWGAQRSRSADSLCRTVNDCMVQEWNRFPNDNQKPKWITRRQALSQFYCLQDGNKGPFKPGLIPNLNPAFAPVPPGKNAVRRLINTFSQGVCDSSNQKALNGPTNFRGKKGGFLPIITNHREHVSTNGNNNINSYPLGQQFLDKPEAVDVNSFPPPPPEILMDNSFEKNKSPNGDECGTETPNQRCSTQTQKCYVSQCARASVQRVSSNPSQDGISRGSLNISEASPNGQDFVDKNHPEQDSDQPNGDKDKENDDATGLFQHSQTIKQCHSTDILAKLGKRDEGDIMSFSERARGKVSMGNMDSSEGEASTLYSNSHTPTSPQVSRVRIPPSSYSTCHRGPSPTALPSSTSCPVNGQAPTSNALFTSQIEKWTRRYSEDENGIMTASSSISFYDARSVFCQNNQSASESVKPSCRSTLPRPWGEPKFSRGRLQATYLPQTFRKSIPYRPTPTEHQLLLNSEATTLNNGRKEYVAEKAQCSKQGVPVSCSVSGSQEAKAKIMDKRD